MIESQSARSSLRRGERALLFLLLAAGTAFRLRQYVFCRSLWLDEAMLAVNIAGRSFTGLLQRMDFNQTAPVLFLWVERLFVAAFGAQELGFRAFPLAAGLVSVPLAFGVGRAVFGAEGALTTAAVAALSPALLRYSNETKPYASDALATLILVWGAMRLMERPEARGRRLSLLLLGWLAVLTSHPAAFVAGGVLATLAIAAWPHPRRLAFAASCAALWGATVGGLYRFLYSVTAASQNQQQGYGGAFLVPGPDFWPRASLAVRGTLLPTFLGNGSTIPALAPPWIVAIALVVLAGALALLRRGRTSLAILLTTPLMLAFLASALRRYPIGVPRLMVFASPLLALLAGSAADAFAARFGRRALLAVATLALLPTLRDAIVEWRSPFRGEDTRLLVEQYRAARRGEQEPVYVSNTATPAWLFYTTNWSGPKPDRLAFYASIFNESAEFQERLADASPDAKPQGESYVYDSRGRREIVGLATGRDWVWPGYTRADPKRGWANNEAKRVYAEAIRNPKNPCAWILFTRLSERGARPLTWVLRDRYQGTRDADYEAPGGVLYRYCFKNRPAAGAD